MFGGVAFTWEHDVHLLQRRVLSCERRFGDALTHERRLGAALATRRTAVDAHDRVERHGQRRLIAEGLFVTRARRRSPAGAAPHCGALIVPAP